jgi:diguanylate cyclase (GGDEF)-like protein
LGTTESGRLRQSLQRLIEAGGCGEDELLAGTEERSRPGQPLYSSLLYVLTHLSFSEPQARRHWQRITAHRRSLATALGRDAGLRVALLDYFVNVTRELENPKLIELAIFEKTERRSLTDGLTGLFNRTYFLQALRREVHRARRRGLEVSLALFDLDDFKRINDTRGHLAGDRVLSRTASLVTASLREVDVCARYGGEEFAVILPDTDRDGARIVAERIRCRVEAQLGNRRRGAAVTVSGGIATFPHDALDPVDLVHEADRLLYRAKAEGKNRIAVREANLRRHERRPLQHAIEVAVEPGRVMAAVTRNISEGGLLLEAPERVEEGNRIGLVVRPSNARPISLHGQVVRSQCCGDAPSGGSNGHRFELGLRLLTEPRRNRMLLGLGSPSA